MNEPGKTDTKYLRDTLETHLDTLKRNIDKVSLPVLKTKYRKPYDALCKEISTAATAYTQAVALHGFRLKKQYFEETVPMIQTAIRQSDLLRQIRIAAFQHQSITEVETLALSLGEQIQKALEPFYERHLCLYVTEECLGESPQIPDIYNDATGCIFKNGKWEPMDDNKNAILIFAYPKQEEAA